MVGPWIELKYWSQIVNASASAKWNGMSARWNPPIVIGVFALIQPSMRPPLTARCWVIHEWSRSMTHCALVFAVSMWNGR